MDLSVWLSYIALITVLIAFPGPSSLLITIHGYQYGLKKTNYSIFGNLFGSIVLMVLSALGLGAILSSSEVMFSIIKYIGGAYLIYLGIKTWNKTSAVDSTDDSSPEAEESSATLLKQGFFTGLSNPKDLLFFTALFPAFINSQSPLAEQFLVLMLTWVTLDYLIKVVYALAGRRVNKQFTNQTFVKVFNRVTGGMFITAGVALASSNK